MNYLFAAYTAIWIILSWYLFSLSRRQRRVENELTRLEDKIKENHN
jgi:CcmD family protein